MRRGPGRTRRGCRGFAGTVHHVFEHRLVGVEVRFLLEHADREAVGQASFARVVGIDTGHDLQQRRLASTVRAEHPDLCSWEERERDVDDVAVRRNELADLVHGVDELRCHRG